MPHETDLWGTVREKLGPYGDLQRVETDTDLGVPDVNYALRYRGRPGDGWLELKQRPSWPVRGGKVTFPHLTVQQVVWAERRVGLPAYGLVYLLSRVGDAYILHHGSAVRSVMEGMVAEEFIMSSVLYSPDRFPTSDILRILCPVRDQS